MDRLIRIRDCGDCPHLDHRGGYGDVAYVPYCRRTRKNLPYGAYLERGNRVLASRTPGIPKWCPLEEAKYEQQLDEPKD